MSDPVFADTYYYVALLSQRDAAHQLAVDVSRRLTGTVVTSAWVIQELADGLCQPPARLGFAKFLDALRADAHTLLVGPDAGIWWRAIDLYRARPDKAWSLTDGTSFVIMSDRALTQALTADHHFEQAGFVALLK